MDYIKALVSSQFRDKKSYKTVPNNVYKFQRKKFPKELEFLPQLEWWISILDMQILPFSKSAWEKFIYAGDLEGQNGKCGTTCYKRSRPLPLFFMILHLAKVLPALTFWFSSVPSSSFMQIVSFCFTSRA